MNDEACTIFQNLIELSIRMLPIFICLEPKHRNRGTIAAVSVYIWVIMVFSQSLLPIEERAIWVFQGVFSCLYFLVLLVFFEGSALEKLFFYLSAWMFSELSRSLRAFFLWTLAGRLPLSRAQISVVVTLGAAVGFGMLIQFWLREKMWELFDQLSTKVCLLMAAYPGVFLVILLTGTGTIFSENTLADRGWEEIFFFLILCITILLLYIMILNSITGIIERRQTEEELRFARQLISKQREYYDRTLDYMERVRIIKHDFRHHIHALLHMGRVEQLKYLQNLQHELEMDEQLIFCQNQAVNGLLQEYAAKTKAEGISFAAKLDLSAHIPVDDLTLCIVIGNLLENALEASRRLKTGRFIRIQARWMEDHLTMLVENAYNGQIEEKDGTILSSKKDGGLGMLSIRRILNRPGDEFDVCFTEDTFTAMVKIVDRTLEA